MSEAVTVLWAGSEDVQRCKIKIKYSKSFNERLIQFQIRFRPSAYKPLLSLLQDSGVSEGEVRQQGEGDLALHAAGAQVSSLPHAHLLFQSTSELDTKKFNFFSF